MIGTLFERSGGFAAVSRVVLDFYGRVLDSDEAGPYFDDIDMARLIDHQTKFIATLMGGPASFSDARIAQAHAHLSITDTAFDEVSGLLATTLADHGFSVDDVAQVIDEFDRRRGLVVKRPGPA